MKSSWIIEMIMKLKRLHEKCGEKEVALSRYIVCMIRLLNSFSQMEHSQFHFYEEKILWRAIEIFTRHFIAQIEVARREFDVLRKRELIDDIENAVDRMTSVYKNMIDSTANSDRQLISSISLDTSIYELSPKICAFYSLILEKLVEMFDEGGDEYAFVLHPTLKNNTETQIMFEQRKESGKVVIIYISESIIEAFDVVSVFILHEAFHVLTKNERMRKARFGYFMQLIMAGLGQLLFKGIKFAENPEENRRIREELYYYFFSDWKEEAEKWKVKKEDSRDFYSSNVKQWGINYLKGRLASINAYLENWVSGVMLKSMQDVDYKTFELSYKKEKDIIDGIRKNILDVIYKEKTVSLVERFLFIYREIYADIACILMLQLKPESYAKAFEKSKQFRFDEKKYQDSVQKVRNQIVTKAVVNYLPAEIAEEWQKYDQEQNAFKKEGMESEKCSTFQGADVIIDITPQMGKAFLEYAQDCAQAFDNRVGTMDDIVIFRNNMRYICNGDRKELLMRIMIGDFDKIFSKK